ncbi:MAG: glycosyltransferase family 4 protein [Candidatus Micrarchaeota archaeon]|nr:glycosyltransferase family 4 protein [Candidatus Micrarchaeota archaeon]
MAVGAGKPISRRRAGKAKTLGLYVGPHPAYREFAARVCGSEFKVESRVAKKQHFILKAANMARSVAALPKGYSVYFTEGCYYYPAAAKKMHLISKDAKIVNLCCTPVFYNMLTGNIKGAERNLLLHFAHDVDAYICEGRYSEEILHKLGIHKPTYFCYTYISPKRYRVLKRIKPQLESKEVAIIATNDYHYKGVDILLEAMKLVFRADPDVRLNIVLGNINPSHFSHLLSNRVRITDDAVGALRTAALYVHPSRGDVFPVAPLEAMLAGVPVIVSNETGTKEVVEKVRKDFVTHLDAEHVAQKVLHYFAMKPKARETLSRRFRKAALPFNQKEQIRRFRKEYKKVMQKIRD